MVRRDEQTMMQLIRQAAFQDERIRAVVMNGSRASPHAKKDIFQDYDIVYIVTNVEDFVNDKTWLQQFGEVLIKQEPDQMDGNWPKNKQSYGYLVQFKDWNRIDFTFLLQDKIPTWHRDSQSILLLDKDNLLGGYPPASDHDYLPKPPTKKEFENCCNEFLWVTTYVAKGIWRQELTYAKFMAEQVVKSELIKILTWYAATKTNFNTSLGYCSKYLEQYVEPAIWERFKLTYVDADYQHMWESLFSMCELFADIARIIAKQFGFSYNETEHTEVVGYLREVMKLKQ